MTRVDDGSVAVDPTAGRDKLLVGREVEGDSARFGIEVRLVVVLAD